MALHEQPNIPQSGAEYTQNRDLGVFLPGFVGVVTDSRGFIGAATESVRDVLQYEAGQFIGQQIQSFIHEDDVLLLEDILQGQTEENSGLAIRVISGESNGTPVYRTIEFVGVPAPSNETHVLFVGRDRTEEITKDKALQVTILTLSHDIGNRVTEVTHKIEDLDKKLRRTFSRSDAEDLLKPLTKATRRLRRDLRTMTLDATVQFGRHVAIPIEPGYIQEVVSDIDDLAEDVGVHVKVRLKKAPIILGDKAQVQSIVQNLVTNSIKYADRERASAGQAFVEVGFMDDAVTLPDGFSMQTMYVQDNGIGIPEQKLGRVFQFAERFDPTHSHGTGIGLWLVKYTVERMGGSIRFESVRGEGTTFYVSFPVIST